MHSYEVKPRRDKRGVDLISECLPFGSLWYGEPNAVNNAVNYARFFSGTSETVVKVYDEKGEVIAEHKWDARTKRDLVI